jgi:hypothetical protein
VGYTGTNDTTWHDLAELAGLDFEMTAAEGKIHPSRAMFDWYYGYDVSYSSTPTHQPRISMLADQGRSGIVRVGAPNSVRSNPALSGFDAFAQSHVNDATRLYVQTNDGVLHVVNPKEDNDNALAMREEIAILPPPTLLPRRMFSLKTTKDMAWSNQYKWTDIGDNPPGSERDTWNVSTPAYILDGPLQLRYFDVPQSSYDPPYWRGLLFGSLGRGGSGLYVMDVMSGAASPSDPKFYWYRETIEDDDENLRLIWISQDANTPTRTDGAVHAAQPYVKTIARGSTYWDGVYANPGAHAYEQLGFNPPKLSFSIAEWGSSTPKSYKNLIALAGGMQNKLDLDNNGTMGAALYLVDPNKKYHGAQKPAEGVKVFNSGSLSAAPDDNWRFGSHKKGPAPYMGMVNSEPAFLSNSTNNYIADGVLFADNRGSIFYVSFAAPNPNDLNQAAVPWGNWQIYTVASLHLDASAATSADIYSIPWGVAGGMDSESNVWLGGGTANAARADPPSDSVDDQHLTNKSQMIFAFKMPDITKPDAEKTLRGEWLELANIGGELSGEEKEKLKKGWYIPLRVGDNINYRDEYVTMRPVLYGGSLYVATFMESIVNSGSPGACEESGLRGTSRLYAISLKDGRPVFEPWGSGYLDFNDVIFTSFTLSEQGDKPILIARYRKLLDDAEIPTGDPIVGIGGPMGEKAVGVKLPGVNATPDGGGRSPVENNDSVVNYWIYTTK